jgi:Zn-dependent peptidase ImmA (M78 family)
LDENRGEVEGVVGDRVAVNPAVVQWAALSAMEADVSLARFHNLGGWMQGDVKPTFRQLTDFANATAVPLGYFFLDEVPSPTLPIADFRVRGEQQQPSAELLDTITLCSARQDWYSGYVERAGVDAPDFVGSQSTEVNPRDAVRALREHIWYAPGAGYKTQQEALRVFIADIERSGILVVMNSVIENNTHRRLDHREFQGFTLVDPLAPLIFVNGDDTKNARMFTLAHEVAHVFLGEQGVSAATPDLGVDAASSAGVEAWCNAVAAEFLVPLEDVPEAIDRTSPVEDLERAGRRFNVSTLVILRRLREKGVLDPQTFWRIYEEEEVRVRDLASEQRREGDGGNPYNVMPYRVSRRLARAVYADAYEGGTTYREAYRLLSTRTTKSFNGLAERLRVS